MTPKQRMRRIREALPKEVPGYVLFYGLQITTKDMSARAKSSLLNPKNPTWGKDPTYNMRRKK